MSQAQACVTGAPSSCCTRFSSLANVDELLLKRSLLIHLPGFQQALGEGGKKKQSKKVILISSDLLLCTCVFELAITAGKKIIRKPSRRLEDMPRPRAREARENEDKQDRASLKAGVTK